MVAYFHLTRFDNPNNVSCPILQGATFSVIFNYFGDVSNHTPRGQIKTDYAINNGDLLANFTFSPLLYQLITKSDGTQEWATVITAKLTDEVTQAMPIPTLRSLPSDKITVGTNVYVYDVELESPTGEVIRLAQGYVEVLPEVTA